MKSIEITAVIWGNVILKNFWNGLVPSTSAASYKSFGMAWRRARINKKAKGKYLQISNIIIVVSGGNVDSEIFSKAISENR